MVERPGWHDGMSFDEWDELWKPYQMYLVDLSVYFDCDTFLRRAECDGCGATVTGYPATAARQYRVWCPVCCVEKEAHKALRRKLEERDGILDEDMGFEALKTAIAGVAAKTEERSRILRGPADRPRRKRDRKQMEAQYRARIEHERQMREGG